MVVSWQWYLGQVCKRTCKSLTLSLHLWNVSHCLPCQGAHISFKILIASHDIAVPIYEENHFLFRNSSQSINISAVIPNPTDSTDYQPRN